MKGAPPYLNYQKQKKEKELRRQLNLFLNEESAKPGEFVQDIRDIENQLEVIDCERYRGDIVRARSQRLWLGERPSKRALSDEKRYAQRNEIKEIRYGNTITGDKKTIERAFVEYYNDLMGHSVPKDDGFDAEFLSLMPTLEEDVRENLELAISVRVIEDAIDELTAGKTPGPDGLSAEFYETFKREAADALYEVLTKAYCINKLPPFFFKNHVVLIPNGR